MSHGRRRQIRFQDIRQHLYKTEIVTARTDPCIKSNPPGSSSSTRTAAAPECGYANGTRRKVELSPAGHTSRKGSASHGRFFTRTNSATISGRDKERQVRRHANARHIGLETGPSLGLPPPSPMSLRWRGPIPSSGRARLLPGWGSRRGASRSGEVDHDGHTLLTSFNRLKMPDRPQTTEISMEQKKKGSLSSKEPQTRAEHLRQSKGISLPKRIEAKRAGAGIATRHGRKR
jgi:hypothetical protein